MFRKLVLLAVVNLFAINSDALAVEYPVYSSRGALTGKIVREGRELTYLDTENGPEKAYFYERNPTDDEPGRFLGYIEVDGASERRIRIPSSFRGKIYRFQQGRWVFLDLHIMPHGTGLAPKNFSPPQALDGNGFFQDRGYPGQGYGYPAPGYGHPAPGYGYPSQGYGEPAYGGSYPPSAAPGFYIPRQAWGF